MDYALVTFVALCASILTFFSGFGLGTLLLPAFAVFLPVEAAVAATAIVHLVNNLAKVALVGRHADKAVTPRFAAASIVGALAGAGVLGMLAGAHAELFVYQVAGRDFSVTAINAIIGMLMIAFAVGELVQQPALAPRGAPTSQRLWLGGLVSGFFGGLSGHQGALRSAFLNTTNLSKESLVGTRAVCAVAVDCSRLLVYALLAALAVKSKGPFALDALADHETWGLICAGGIAAIAGSLAGKRLLKEVTLRAVRISVAVALLALGAALAAGLV